ncbi:MAG: TonB-dependent receptor [Halothiobacillus sp.]
MFRKIHPQLFSPKQLCKKALVLLCATGAPVLQADDIATDDVRETRKLTAITIQGDNTNTTGNFATLDNMSSFTQIDGASAQLATGPAGVSPSMVIQNTPSVNFQSADAYGLTEVGFHETLKIRGVGQTGPASSRNIDGMPVTGNPGGSKGILDMENIKEVSIYRGAAPVDRTLGFSNLPGKINLEMQAPRDKMQTDYRITTGSDSFNRVFLRQDSGKIGQFSSFVSASYSAGDQWKGAGDSQRKNLTAGFKLDGGDAWQAELYAGFNQDARHTYRFFDYKTASNLANYRLNWGTNPAKPDFYGYNRQDFTDRFVFGTLKARLAPAVSLTFKPYFLNETGTYWFSSLNAQDPSKSRVIGWPIQHENLGAITELDWQLGNTSSLKTGLWLHSQQPPGPPVTQQKYKATPQGLAFDGWSVLAKNDRHRIISPYASWFTSVGAIDFEAGLRYVDMRLGAINAYNNTGAAARLSDADAARQAGGINSTSSAPAKTLNEWLPFLGANWHIDSKTSLQADFGRTYGLDVNLFPYYYAQQASFAAKGIPFASLWDRLTFETADNLDISLRHVEQNWYSGVTLFYAVHHNKQSTIYDPSVDARYPWNAAKASRYGIELEGGIAVTPQLSLFGNYSYNRFRYDENLALAANATIATQGKQVVDTPEHMLKISGKYTLDRLTFGLDGRYLGARFGDVLNQERVSGVTLLDARAQYKINAKTTLTLEALNLLNRHYIGPINAADDAISNITAAFNGVTGNGSSYQYGAPRSVFLSLSGRI